MSKQISVKHWNIVLGYSGFSGFGLGFHIDRYSLSVDLGPFWIGIER